MAVGPLEVHGNNVCKDCKQQGRGAVDAVKTTSRAGTSAGKSRSRKKVRSAVPSDDKVRKKNEAAKEQEAGKEIFWFDDPKLEGNDPTGTTRESESLGKQSGSEAADAKEQKEQSNTTTSMTTTPVAPVPVAKGIVLNPKITVAEQGWVKVKQDPDLETVALGDAKDPDIDEDQDNRNAGQSKTGLVKSPTPTNEESMAQDEELPEWELMAGEEAEYLQGVDGWEAKDEKSKCRMN
jgi:hypothetical protein